MDINKDLSVADAISGQKMAEYLRMIATAVESSEKLFTAKLRITIFHGASDERE